MTTTPFHNHNHAQCIASALAMANQLCKDRGVHLTKVRQRVLELVWQSHQPIGAYDLLASLAKEGYNSAPPTIYRALDFLQQQGLIHKLTSINAYSGCSHPGTPHEGHFFMCIDCQQVLEVDTTPIQKVLQTSAKAHSFRIKKQTIEVTGTCLPCQKKAKKKPT